MNVADDSSCIRTPVARQMSHLPGIVRKRSQSRALWNISAPVFK